jgi:hypothetical protein
LRVRGSDLTMQAGFRCDEAVFPFFILLLVGGVFLTYKRIIA